MSWQLHGMLTRETDYRVRRVMQPPVDTGITNTTRMLAVNVSGRPMPEHLRECITHAGHSIAFNNVFALCDPVTLTFDLKLNR